MKIVCTNPKPDGTPCGYVWKPGVTHRCKYSTPRSRGEKPPKGPRHKAHRCASCRKLYLGTDHVCEVG